MKPIIETILLVDDDSFTNLYNKTIIDEEGIAKNVFYVNSATAAIEFLKNQKNGVPNVILLDINMPVINGWEFLEQVEDQFIKKNDKCKVFMLSASQNPDDIEKSKKFPCVSWFLNKPLNLEVLKKHIA